jgi:hypothetical protein
VTAAFEPGHATGFLTALRALRAGEALVASSCGPVGGVSNVELEILRRD